MLRALLVVVIVASVLGAIAVVWPIFDDRVLQPVQDNAIETAAIENRLDETDDRLGEIELQITQLVDDLDGVRGTQDDLSGSVDALGVRIEELTTELQRLDGLETDLGDRVDREMAVLRSMELMSRARLFLYQANYGLAEQDVAAAKSVLEASRSVGSASPGDGNTDDDTIDAVIERLDVVLTELPNRPVAASDDLDIAWQLLLGDIPLGVPALADRSNTVPSTVPSITIPTSVPTTAP